MRTSIIIYPFCAELLPVVRHFNDLQNRYSIFKLVSLPGTGLVGHDAAFACNFPETGFTVEEKIDFSDPSWEAILLVRTLDSEVFSQSNLVRMAKKAFDAGKKVVYLDNHATNVPKEIVAMVASNPLRSCIYTNDLDNTVNNRIDESFCQFDIPVLLVGGLLTEADVFEVLLGLVSNMKKDGLRPMVFARHPICKMFGFHSVSWIFDRTDLTEAQKISEMNFYVKDCENTERPDLILLEAPDAVIRFSDVYPNGFGIQSYMMSLAVRPDSFICCIPFDLADSSYINVLSNDFLIRLGTPINIAHISNVVVDSADLLQTRNFSCVHTALIEVQRKIGKTLLAPPIPLIDAVTDSGVALYSEIRKSLQ